MKKSKKIEREVIAFNPPVEWIKEKILEAGNTIGSVHFVKRSNNKLRKMSYRLHVKPVLKTLAMKTKKVEKIICVDCGMEKGKCQIGPFQKILVAEKIPIKPRKKINKSEVDKKNNQMTVYDANNVRRDKDNKIIGRGDYRTVPLEKVTRIKNNKTTYIIKQYDEIPF